MEVTAKQILIAQRYLSDSTTMCIEPLLLAAASWLTAVERAATLGQGIDEGQNYSYEKEMHKSDHKTLRNQK